MYLFKGKMQFHNVHSKLKIANKSSRLVCLKLRIIKTRLILFFSSNHRIKPETFKEHNQPKKKNHVTCYKFWWQFLWSPSPEGICVWNLKTNKMLKNNTMWLNWNLAIFSTLGFCPRRATERLSIEPEIVVAAQKFKVLKICLSLWGFSICHYNK